MSDNNESFEEWLDEHFLDSPCLTQYGKDWICAKAVREKLQALEEDNKILRDAVEFYGNQSHFYGEVTECDLLADETGEKIQEMGTKARQALEKVGGGE